MLWYLLPIACVGTKDVGSQCVPDAVWLRMETREWVEALQVKAKGSRMIFQPKLGYVVE